MSLFVVDEGILRAGSALVVVDVEDIIGSLTLYALFAIEKWSFNGAVCHIVVFYASLIVLLHQVIDSLRA